ncbi:MAG: RsmG family class I SAM-dependent methyltransferase [Acidimicrobiales bacterium]
MLGDGPGVVFDLGSGGGLPSLPCALAAPAWTWVLLERRLRRADHLASACRRLGLADRVEVIHARAEDVGRDPSYRSTGDVVTARAFGPPAAVAECAAPLLRIGGRLLVSEPPDSVDRWPEDGLAQVGLSSAVHREADGYAIAELGQASACPDRYPRRAGRGVRKPLF